MSWNALMFNELTSGSKDVLGQLFLCGPTWDGNIISKMNRDELVELGLAIHRNGWAFLTEAGVDMAIKAPVKDWHNQAWYRKQQNIV